MMIVKVIVTILSIFMMAGLLEMVVTSHWRNKIHPLIIAMFLSIGFFLMYIWR